MAKDYNISKATGRCAGCRKELAPGEEFAATVREAGEEFGREDYCLDCWESKPDKDAPELFGVWRSRVARPQEKRKLFVDDELLIHFFERLDEAEEDVKVSFRYVLALVLMRKRLLVYDRTERSEDGREIWLMHFKGDNQTHRVIDPKMDEDKIAEVSSRLGQILEGAL